MEYRIQSLKIENLERYGEIYAEAFNGEPWNDPWKVEDAIIHVKELLESKQSYGLEGVLPEFYERYGFKKEKEVILMGMEL